MMLQSFVRKNNFKFSVSMETSLAFSLWTFPKMCKLYEIGGNNDLSLSSFPIFACRCKKLDGDKEKIIVKHLITDLGFRLKTIPIGNEASKSQFVGAYLVA